MIRRWIAIAALAASWLPGLGYYHPASAVSWTIWAGLVAVGAALLIGRTPRMPGRAGAVAAAILAAVAIGVWRWPYVAVPILLAAGLMLHVLPIPRSWPRRLGSAAVLAGLVLLAQAAAMYGYEALTARGHDLPGPLAHGLGKVAWLLGQTSTVSNNNIALYSMRQVHHLGATWELLLDPLTVCFLIGGIAALLAEKGWRESLRPVATLAILGLAWLPLRAGLLMALYMHRALVTDYDGPMNVMNQWWSTPLLAGLLAGPVLLAWRWVGRPRGGADAVGAVATDISDRQRSPVISSERSESRNLAVAEGEDAILRRVPSTSLGVTMKKDMAEVCGAPMRARRLAAVALAALAAATLTVAMVWDPVGERKAGRVLVDEFHSRWEPTDTPMSPDRYGHLTSYTYSTAYDYCSRFYDLGRLTQSLSDSSLAACDVLILKMPTEPYTSEECEAVRRFVEGGGGLLLVGDHTNVFGTSEHLNAVAHPFGIEYIYDCAFGIDSFFEDRYELPLVPHPIVQATAGLDFEISCTLASRGLRGYPVMRGLGLKNAPADYHASNFYPQAEDRPDMRYGAFLQLVATRCGQGRVVAFTDSTQWSDFSMFEPGKPELLLGMIEWANHKASYAHRDIILFLVGLALAAGSLFLSRRAVGLWVILMAAGLAGHAGAAVGLREVNARAMPLPTSVRPYVLAVMDRTVSGVPLPTSGFIDGKENGFGIFERWILRLGYFTRRAAGPEAVKGDLLVVINPDRTVQKAYLDSVVRYVEGGGRLLVLDSARNTKSTAESLLWPFGLAVNHEPGGTSAGAVYGIEGAPTVAAESACEVTGGVPFAFIEGRPVGAAVRFGKGTVVAIGFSSRFSDATMGVTGDSEPDAAMRDVYEVEFRLIRAIVEGKLPAAAAAPATTSAPAAATPP
jgi:hypothetical protein